MSFQSCGSKSLNGARRWIPALLTRMSGTPCSATSAPTPSRTAPASVTSKETVGTSPPPAAATCSRAPASACESRLWRTTRAPCRARPSASASPRPREEPVTSASRPVMSKRATAVPPGSEDGEDGEGEEEPDHRLQGLLDGPRLQGGLDVHPHEPADEPEARVVDVAGEDGAGRRRERDGDDLQLAVAAGRHGRGHEPGRR